MESDIVTRLRGAAAKDYGCTCVKCEAADEIERLRAELAAERATSASLLRTVALIREAGKFTREDLDALPGAVKAMREQRDEARRDACAFQGMIKFQLQNPKVIISTEATLRLAKEIAAERGWDCFKRGGGA